MKKFFALLLALTMIFALAACGSEQDNAPASAQQPEQTEQSDTQEPAQQPEQTDAGKNASSEWPTNTIFPEPEGCKIIEVKGEDWKNYITVEWDSKDAAKDYIEIAKEAEGDTAEVIGQGETDDTVYYGTYGITITSMNEAENIVLYK